MKKFPLLTAFLGLALMLRGDRAREFTNDMIKKDL